MNPLNRAKVTGAVCAVALQTEAWKYPAIGTGMDLELCADLPPLIYALPCEMLLCNTVKEC